MFLLDYLKFSIVQIVLKKILLNPTSITLHIAFLEKKTKTRALIQHWAHPVSLWVDSGRKIFSPWYNKSLNLLVFRITHFRRNLHSIDTASEGNHVSTIIQIQSFKNIENLKLFKVYIF